MKKIHQELASFQGSSMDQINLDGKEIIRSIKTRHFRLSFSPVGPVCVRDFRSYSSDFLRKFYHDDLILTSSQAFILCDQLAGLNAIDFRY